MVGPSYYLNSEQHPEQPAVKRRKSSSPLTALCPSEMDHECDIGRDAIRRFADCTFWSWKVGSTLHFWRWGTGPEKEYAKDGMESYILGPMPKNKQVARTPKGDKYELYIPKIRSIIEKGYVRPGTVTNLTDYFDVPKPGDIHLVYNGTSCGLNNMLWAPSFWLPTPDSALNVMDFMSHSVDLDFGEMFLNFPNPKLLQPVSGVDFTPFRKGLADLLVPDDKDKKAWLAESKTCWLRWKRNWMGATPSPHSSARF
jgi:hypothetical protein